MTSPADEIVQIVDRDNRPVATVKRSIMRKMGLTHRASYVLVLNASNQLFVQKRTQTKDIFPGFWDVAAGGVVLAGEDYRYSAERELKEELGVGHVPLKFLFDHYYEDGSNKVWGHVFSCRHEGPFTLQEEEVEYGKFLSVPEIFQLSEHEAFTPDGIEILKRVVRETEEINNYE